MKAPMVFALVVLVAAFNGFSISMIAVTMLVWMLLSYKESIASCVLAVVLISYVAMAHALPLNTSLKGCANVVQHYEKHSVFEFQSQRFQVFQPFTSDVVAVCAHFDIKHALHLQRLTLDPLTRYRQSMRIRGVATITTMDRIETSVLQHIRHKLKAMIFVEKEDSLFWLVHHSGLWISSLISLTSSLLHLKFKVKTVNLIMHIIICGFTWLMWDVRTLRLLIISSLKLLKVPHTVASYIALVSVILMFPYMIVSPAFLFPMLFYVLHVTKISNLKRWLIMIALQQWLFASWSVVFMFLYVYFGKVILLFDIFDRLFPTLHTTAQLSIALDFLNGVLRFYGGIQGNTFFAFVFILCFNFKPMLQKVILGVCTLIIIIQPLRWIPQIHFINVGQGHATLVQYRFQNILIDTGTQSHVHYVMHFLNYHRVNQLDALLITHDHADHRGGVERLIRENVVSSLYPYKTSWHDVITIDSLINKRFENSKNEDSAIYLIQLPRLSVLITGDAYHQQELLVVNTYLNLKADVLLVGHHGSKTSSHPDFIAHIKPSLAIISAHSSFYGHPHRETLRTLQQFQVPHLETEHVGDISIYILPWFKLVLSSDGGFAIMR